MSYQPRTFEITLSMLGSRERFHQMVSEVVNRFAGHLVSVVFSEESDFYAIGTLQPAPPTTQYPTKANWYFPVRMAIPIVIAQRKL